MAKIFLLLATIGAAMWGFISQQMQRQSQDVPQVLTAARGVAQGTATMVKETANIALSQLPNLASGAADIRNIITDRASPNLSGHTVPFTAQAPFGDWADQRQEEGCEEASLVMAKHWLDGTSLTKSQALTEILDLSAASEKTIGEWRSTNAEDTARLFREYYHYDNVSVEHDITTTDIAREVAAGNLVLVPTDGQKLKNPHYKSPGPPEHMLVVYAYDETKDEFVTNDPGTKYGRGYRYPSARLAGALYDYPTGYRTPVDHPRTAMIVVNPKTKS